MPLVNQFVDLGGHEPGLVVLGVCDISDDLASVTGIAPQPLGRPVGVVFDHRVGRRQDRLCGAVVLLQQDRACTREVVAEVEDVADGGTAERVDRLVGIADHHQLTGGDAWHVIGQSVVRPQVAAELLDQQVLGVVGVLVFVNQHLPESASVGLAHLRVLLEQLDGLHDQIVEIERVRGPKPLVVLGVGGGMYFVEPGRLGAGLGGVDQFVLAVADPVEQ